MHTSRFSQFFPALIALAISQFASAWPNESGAQTSFVVQKHGFNFVNYFEGDILIDVPLIGRVDFGDTSYGLCGGMTYAALDTFIADQDAPDMSLPQSGSEMQSYLYGRQIDTFKIDNFILIRKLLSWAWRAVATQAFITGLHDLTDDEFKKNIAPKLDQGKPVPLLLVRARSEDYLPSDDALTPEGFTKNHQVLAIGYRRCPETPKMKAHWAIDIYDPNYADVVCTLHYSKDKRGQTLKHHPDGSLVMDTSQQKLEGFRGFFAVPYKHKAPFWVKTTPSVKGRLMEFGAHEFEAAATDDESRFGGKIKPTGERANGSGGAEALNVRANAASPQLLQAVSTLEELEAHLADLNDRLDQLEQGKGQSEAQASAASATTRPSRGLPTKNLPDVKASEGDTAIAIRGRPGIPFDIRPNPAMKGRLGRLVIIYPESTASAGPRADVYKAGADGTSILGKYGNVSAELLAGNYGVVITGVRLEQVEIKAQHDTIVHVGGLHVNAGEGTRFDVFLPGEKESLIGFYGEHHVGLPPGKYEIEIAGQRDLVEIKRGEITEF